MHLTRYSAATHVGLKRSNNEDFYLCRPKLGLWLVADGMGGHAAGEVASAIVSKTIQDKIADGKSLEEAIRQSHHAVLNAAAAGVGGQGMGSTVVALHSTNEQYRIAWVGDSRAYHWSTESKSLRQLTKDHSYVQMLFESGAISESELDTHPEKNIITQCLGSIDMDDVKVDAVEGTWDKNDWILLCSDGLTDAVNNDRIETILRETKDIHSGNEELMQAALDGGGRDNITIQLVGCPGSLLRAIQNTTKKINAILR